MSNGAATQNSGGQVSLTFRVRCPGIEFGQSVYLCREDNEEAMSKGWVSCLVS